MKKKRTFIHDENGYKYKFPSHSCKYCLKCPCFEGFESHGLDFAKYGCIDYEEA